jgi:hypothetical protein
MAVNRGPNARSGNCVKKIREGLPHCGFAVSRPGASQDGETI